MLAHGNTGTALNKADSPDLYISRDGGISWTLTLRGTWKVTIVGHGELIVAVREKAPSSELYYSCNEGLSWSRFTYSSFGDMTVHRVHSEEDRNSIRYKNSVVTLFCSILFIPFFFQGAASLGWGKELLHGQWWKLISLPFSPTPACSLTTMTGTLGMTWLEDRAVFWAGKS